MREFAMRTVILVVGTLIAAVVTVGAIFVVGMRRKTPAVLNAVRRSGRAMKPLVLRSAGRTGAPTSVVEHTGRNTGSPYETPVVAAPIADGFVVALPYGPNTDWLKNVVAAGRATIRFDGHPHAVDLPEVVPMEEVATDFAPREQRMHRQFNVRDALRVRTVSIDAGAVAPRTSA
jgi:deazaflavin-dependent oxidoreductase (nitroreductase family)